MPEQQAASDFLVEQGVSGVASLSRRRMLRCLECQDIFSPTNIQNCTGLALGTVQIFLGELLAAGVIISQGTAKEAGKRGRPANQYAVADTELGAGLLELIEPQPCGLGLRRRYTPPRDGDPDARARELMAELAGVRRQAGIPQRVVGEALGKSVPQISQMEHDRAANVRLGQLIVYAETRGLRIVFEELPPGGARPPQA